MMAGAPALAQEGVITWQWREESSTAHPNFFTVLENGNLLVCRNGYRDPSVVELDPAGQIVWTYPNMQAASAVRLPNGNTLIADSGAPGAPFYPRVIEVTPEGEEIWEYRLPGRFLAPRYVQRLANGNTLITTVRDVREVSPTGEVVWRYAGELDFPVQARRLPSETTLIVDKGWSGGRVLEVNRQGQMVWSYGNGTAGVAAGQLVAPTAAQRLADGRTRILDPGSRRWVEVDAAGQPVRVVGWLEVFRELPVTYQWAAWAGVAGEANTLYLAATLSSGRSLVLQAILPGLQVEINGSWFYPEQLPWVQDATLMLPARGVAEALGVGLHWDAAAKSLTFFSGARTVQVTMDTPTALVDGQPVVLAAVPVTVDGVSYVPLDVFRYLPEIEVVGEPGSGRIELNRSSQAVGDGGGAQ